MAVSLDGFIAGPSDEDHGLHDYFFTPSGPTLEVIEEGSKLPNIIMGRRAYEVGAAQDGFADNPYQVPTFVLTHHVPEKVSKGAESFIFVTDGIESALEQAKALQVTEMWLLAYEHRSTILQAGLDEMQIHLNPILFGTGIRLFDHLDTEAIELEKTRVIDGSGVIHLRFRVVRR
jgi:dihydrofolate reductase